MGCIARAQFNRLQLTINHQTKEEEEKRIYRGGRSPRSDTAMYLHKTPPIMCKTILLTP